MVSQIDWHMSAEVKIATTFNFKYASFGQHKLVYENKKDSIAYFLFFELNFLGKRSIQFIRFRDLTTFSPYFARLNSC